MATCKDEILTMDSRVTLSDNNTMPRLGLGTWRSEPGKVQNIVKEAILNCGYRLIDGAWVYKNENEVGNSIHEALEQSQGKIKREDLFITTKLWNQHHVPEDVEWAFRDSLQKLRLDYVDLYLMHWPIAFKKMNENQWSQNEDKTVRYYAEGITLADTWKAMERLVDLKLVRSIGLSNFKPLEIDEILQTARIKPVVNQVELHPYLNQYELREYCTKQNIIITSYCPLANLKRPNEREEEASALYNPIIQEIAKSKNRTTAQIIIRWHLQHGLTVIPKTVTPERLYENCQVFDFTLSDNEMDQIEQLDKTNHRRFVNPPFLRPGAAILVLINDLIVYQRCFGLANLDKSEKITPETNFRLASLTKQFTAYGIILLEQQGKLSRNDTLGHFFSDKFKKKCPFISNKITIQHLLDHSSGLFDYEDNDLVDHKQWSDYDVLEIINDKTFFQPGTQYRYSNTGYILLGLIIEIVSSKPLEDFFHQKIFQPFNMKTSILYNSDKTLIENRALGYIKKANEQNYELSDQSSTSATRGDGGIYMSLNDYLQWYRHYHLLSLTSIFPIDETLSSTYYYNLGWFLSDSSGQIRLHSGNSCGFTHQVFRIDDKQRKILVLYLTNIGNNNEKIQKFNRLVIEKIPQLNPNNTNLLWNMVELTR